MVPTPTPAVRPITAIVVDDTLQALMLLATERRHHTAATVVGITGSVGKTSTKEALFAALSALGWVLADDDRAERLLSLTGLTPDVLRDNLTDRTTLAAVLEYLAGHEPDLLLAADALNVPPEKLIAAHRELTA